MNACIQDGFNLGWELALVLHGQAKKALLDTYESERRRAAQILFESADELHHILGDNSRFMPERIPMAKRDNLPHRTVLRVSASPTTIVKRAGFCSDSVDKEKRNTSTLTQIVQQ